MIHPRVSPPAASELAQMIDHTLLRPEAAPRMIEAGASSLDSSAGMKITLELAG